MADIFISHSSADKDLARAFIKILENSFKISREQIRCSSVYGLPIGEFRKRIREDINNCKLFVALITPNSSISSWVLFEIGHAWGCDKDIVPILVGLDYESVPELLKAYQIKEVKKKEQITTLIDELRSLKIWEIQSDIHLLVQSVDEFLVLGSQVVNSNQIVKTQEFHHKEISLGPYGRWNSRFDWEEPEEIRPKAAFIGDIYGNNCAEVVISFGYFNEKNFGLFVYNPSSNKIDVHLKFRIVIIYML